MNKGLLFFYDWLMPLSRLTDEEFRSVVNIMVNYHKCEFEVPSLEGNAGLALDFIIPQIDRMKENVKNGKKGGRPKKEQADEKEVNTNKEEVQEKSASHASEWEALAEIATRKRDTLQAQRLERQRTLKNYGEKI